MDNKHRISRREFLKWTGVGTAAVLASGCVVVTPTPETAAPAAEAKPYEGVDLSFQNFALWIEETNEWIDQSLAQWGESTGATVNVEYVGLGDLPAKYATVAESRSGVDVVAFRGMLGALYTDLLIDLDDIAQEVEAAYGPWVEFAKTFAFRDGHWKVLPWWVQAHGLIHRLDWFREAGYETFPDTWEELLTAGEKLKQAGHPMGFALGHALGDGNQFCLSVLWSFGGQEFAEDGETILLDSPETRNAIEFMKEFYDKAMDPAVVSWDDAANNRGYLAEALSCTNNSPSIYAAALRENPPLAKVSDHAVYPAGPAKRAAWLELNTLGVYDFSKNQEAAKDMIRHLVTEDVWTQWLRLGVANNVPPLEQWLARTDMPWHVDPKLQAIAEELEYGQLAGHDGSPNKTDARSFQSFVINDMFARAVQGESADAAVDWAVKQLQQLVA